MPGPGFPLTIMEFQERFASEEACREYRGVWRVRAKSAIALVISVRR
jgi:hypothetical protein